MNNVDLFSRIRNVALQRGLAWLSCEKLNENNMTVQSDAAQWRLYKGALADISSRLTSAASLEHALKARSSWSIKHNVFCGQVASVLERLQAGLAEWRDLEPIQLSFAEVLAGRWHKQQEELDPNEPTGAHEHSRLQGSSAWAMQPWF